MDYLRKTTKSVNWYYRRRVPQDVQQDFGKVWVEESLGTSDKREAKKRAVILSARLEETWDTMRGQGSPLQRWQSGISWLAEQGTFRAVVPGGDEEDADTITTLVASEMFEEMEQGKASLPPGATKEAFSAWLRGEDRISTPDVTFTDALKLWVRERRPTSQAERGARRVVKQFDVLTGGTPLARVTRLQARKYRDALVSSGTAPGSIQTYISYLRSVFNMAIKEEMLDDKKANPFVELLVERDKAEVEDRAPIPRTACLEVLQQALADGYDQADWFAAVLLTTGMRPIEAYKAKMVVDAPVPYWDVPRAKKSPPRHVPIHPMLIGKKPVPFTVRAEQLRRAFIERYKPYTGYQCRHSWKDEAVKINMPMELRLRLMGHSLKRAIGVNSTYGGAMVDLEQAKPWVDAMWKGS